MDVTGSVFYDIDAGGGSEGDTLALVGAAAGLIEIDLSASPGDDQSPAATASARGSSSPISSMWTPRPMSGAGVTVRGNGTDNFLFGTQDSDRFTGLAGADTLRLGLADGASDRARYEGAADGFGSTAAARQPRPHLQLRGGHGQGRIHGRLQRRRERPRRHHGRRHLYLRQQRQGQFLDDPRRPVHLGRDGQLKTDNLLYQSGFTSVLKAINSKLVGVTAAAGDDGLIAVQAGGSTGLYYYQESDGIANKVSAAS